MSREENVILPLAEKHLTPEDWVGKPIIAIVNTWSDINPCHAHFKARVEDVKRGVLQAGGFPLELPAISLSESQVKPTTMLYRNLLAMETEELLRSHPVDGAVLMGGCDKTTPGLLMGAISMGLPAIFMPAGPMLRGNWKGKVLGSGSDAWKYWDERRAGRITEALYGKEMAEMEKQIDQTDLLAEVKDMSPADQALALPPLSERDPDEALSQVAYVKGAWFLQFLEQRYGREDFDAFLRAWFDTHAFQSADSDQFLAFLKSGLMAKRPGVVSEAEVMEWLVQPGVPAFAPQTASPRFDAVDAARASWLEQRAAARELDTAAWTTQEWVYFLEGLPEVVDAERLVELDQAFRFTGTSNGELAQRWYPLSVRSGYFEARPAMSLFLRKIGRRKLIMPTYEALVASEEGLAFATQVYEMSKAGYHPITRGSVESVLAKAREAADAGTQ